MSNPILQMATHLAANSDSPGSPAETLAHAYLHQHREKQLLEARYSELYKRFNELVHRHAECPIVQQRAANERTGPGLRVYCDKLGCNAYASINIPPPDEFIPQWVRGIGWAAIGEGEYLCPVHK